MDSRIIPFEEICKCIDKSKSFVLQGGAGSGKTETLKKTLKYISEKYPNKKIACITHTNLAVDEIKERIGEVEYNISTIHSFLNSFIKNYKKNIHQVIFQLFRIDLIERLDIEYYSDEKEQKKKEYEKYKKLYEKYSALLFKIRRKKNNDKVIGKRNYDTEHITYNKQLNSKIEELNKFIKNEIQKKDFNKIEYNNSQFDNYKNITYGHDGLIKIASLLFEKYPLLSKILNDKYDFIFIDEYQDTNKHIIDFFIKSKHTQIGLFGDSMQSIYADGIGDVNKYIENKQLKKIIKEDNYRCSKEIIEFINNLRDDGLTQEVALKKDEKSSDRKGNVQFFYAIYKNKPHNRTNMEDKYKYINFINKLVKKIDKESQFKKLMLTHSSIAKELNFENLYQVFTDRYYEPKKDLDETLVKLQFQELYQLYTAYNNREYNFILNQLKKNGLAIETLIDKQKIKKNIEQIINTKLSAMEILDYSFKNKLIKKNDELSLYYEQRKEFTDSIKKDKEYKSFKSNYKEHNTYTKMKKISTEIEEGRFKELEQKVKKEKFYNNLFSEKIKFHEIINYFEYIDEKTEYITMHKTKGSSIDNVLVVLDEYFWNKEYNFQTLFNSENNSKKLKNQKLFYVACSRAKKNLSCLRIVKDEQEKEKLLEFFPNAKELKLEE